MLLNPTSNNPLLANNPDTNNLQLDNNSTNIQESLINSSFEDLLNSLNILKIPNPDHNFISNTNTKTANCADNPEDAKTPNDLDGNNQLTIININNHLVTDDFADDLLTDTKNICKKSELQIEQQHKTATNKPFFDEFADLDQQFSDENQTNLEQQIHQNTAYPEITNIDKQIMLNTTNQSEFTQNLTNTNDIGISSLTASKNTNNLIINQVDNNPQIVPTTSVPLKNLTTYIADLAANSTNQHNSAYVELEPANLGKLAIKMDIKTNHLAISLSCDNKYAASLLNAQIPMIEQILGPNFQQINVQIDNHFYQQSNNPKFKYHQIHQNDCAAKEEKDMKTKSNQPNLIDYYV